MKLSYFLTILLFATLFSCEEEVLIKPKAMLSLNYSLPQYQDTQLTCNYNFKKNKFAQLFVNEDCQAKLKYPENKATVFLTYRDVDAQTIEAAIFEAKKIAYSHKVKALGIDEKLFSNPEDGVYGSFFSIDGNAASHAQFFVTDSTKHFLTGALYFETQPRFDSLYPSISYVRNDMMALMESLKWE